MSRFRDDATSLGELADRILVECHRCGEPGVVTCEPPGPGCTPRFACPGCAVVLEGRHAFWAGPARGRARERCSGCGHRLEETLRSAQGFGAPRTELACPECGARSRAAVEWRGEPPRGAHDPYFGLPLRLQVACAGEVLWAYDARHLALLRDYVEARHRERTPSANRSLASRLPRWLKSASHRDAVLRAIATLEERVG